MHEVKNLHQGLFNHLEYYVSIVIGCGGIRCRMKVGVWSMEVSAWSMEMHAWIMEMHACIMGMQPSVWIGRFSTLINKAHIPVSGGRGLYAVYDSSNETA